MKAPRYSEMLAVTLALAWPAAALVDVVHSDGRLPWWLPLAVLLTTGLPAAVAYAAGRRRQRDAVVASAASLEQLRQLVGPEPLASMQAAYREGERDGEAIATYRGAGHPHPRQYGLGYQRGLNKAASRRVNAIYRRANG